MASSNTRSRIWILSAQLAAAAALLSTTTTARAADPPAAQPTDSPVIIDARQALPMFPANGYKDGFFVEHSPIGDFGLHVRATGVYGRNPLGDADEITNRFTLHTAVILSIAKWVEVGLAMPFVLYQDGSGLNLNSSAIGDLRILGKVNLHLPKKWPQLALSVGIGLPIASSNSALGAGGVSGYPRLILDMPTILQNRLHIAGNIGAVIAGTTRPCTQAELNQFNQQMNMPTMGNMTPGTGMNMETVLPDCQKDVLGLGNHVLYGFGVSAALSFDQGLYLTTELLGSFSVGTEQQTKTPLFWDIGLRRSKANKTFFSASYGLGLTEGSPSHTVLVSLGIVWETKPPAKDKPVPTIRIELDTKNLAPGTTVKASTNKEGVDPVVIEKPAGGPKKPGAPGSPEDKPGDKKPAGPPPPTTVELEIPLGLVPDEGPKDKGGPPKKK